MARPLPFALIILDGWGLRPEREHNAVALAATPNFDRLAARFPMTQLRAHGRYVGLPDGQIGNSEVGHLNLGAGRVVAQDIVRINDAIADGSLADHPILQEACRALPDGASIHLLGLMSDGGVHSHLDHMLYLWRLLERSGRPVYVHAFLDGRDVMPRSAETYLDRIERERGSLQGLASLCGRYYAMDRDRRWERTKQAYDLIVNGLGDEAPDARACLAAAYAAGTSDEFVRPTRLMETGAATATVKPQDLVIMANFRADRMRQLARALGDPDFAEFERPFVLPARQLVTMTEYDAEFTFPILFPPQNIDRPLGAALAEAGLRQLRIAETEKYAHVTYFFNGGEERVYPGEERILIPSPKVATYDLQPKMSAAPLVERLLARLDEADPPDVIILNFANPDMVGHTGDLDATIKAVETTDACLGRIIAALHERGGGAIVCADHGNAELMFDPETQQPHTAHTTNPVPLIVAVPGYERATLRDDGKLADVAPTVLDILGIAKPAPMDHESLVLNRR